MVYETLTKVAVSLHVLFELVPGLGRHVQEPDLGHPFVPRMHHCCRHVAEEVCGLIVPIALALVTAEPTPPRKLQQRQMSPMVPLNDNARVIFQVLLPQFIVPHVAVCEIVRFCGLGVAGDREHVLADDHLLPVLRAEPEGEAGARGRPAGLRPAGGGDRAAHRQRTRAVPLPALRGQEPVPEVGLHLLRRIEPLVFQLPEVDPGAAGERLELDVRHCAPSVYRARQHGVALRLAGHLEEL
mmetsp:Transcript_32796/g.93989  ORF Transcript_32796/g.93989 Transcript_32796/m.93989 type:complete len:241 (-) Transcript_32796:298-1020(-)